MGRTYAPEPWLRPSSSSPNRALYALMGKSVEGRDCQPAHFLLTAVQGSLRVPRF